jgi:hypothetical protein
MKSAFENIMKLDLFKKLELDFINKSISLIDSRKACELINERESQDKELLVNLQTFLKDKIVFLQSILDVFISDLELSKEQRIEFLLNLINKSKNRFPNDTKKADLSDRIFCNSTFHTRLNYGPQIGEKMFYPFDDKGKSIFIEMYSYYKFEYENLIDSIKKILRKLQNPVLSFKELFRHPFDSDDKIQDLKNILKINGYLDDNYKWCGITGQKNELATLFYFLKNQKNILQPNKVKPSIIIFYKEFDLIIAEKKGKGIYSTIKNATVTSGNNIIYNNFNNIFVNWIKE